MLAIIESFLAFGTGGRSGPYDAASVFSLDRGDYEAVLRARERRRRWQELQRLKGQKLIAIRERGDQVIITLTDAGRAALLREQIKNTKTRIPVDSCCLVTFDFPEDARAARNVFRDLIKRAEFKQEQKSVWSSPHDVFEPLQRLIALLKCDDWIHVYRAERCQKVSVPSKVLKGRRYLKP